MNKDVFFNIQLRSQEFQFMISRHKDVKPLARHIVILSSVLVPSSKDCRLLSTSFWAPSFP